MSEDGKPKIRRRRTRGVVGGITQSGFATRSMSEILKQQQKPSGNQKPDAPADNKEKPEGG